MYYHASSVKGITQLTPQSSNHGIPLVYFSTKRENVLVYLSNSIEKYCVETGFSYNGKCQKWGPYGFGKDGRQRLEEYYPNALISTYKGVSGYIYSAETISDSGFSVQIPDVATSSIPVDISGVEFIPDAYEAILQAERSAAVHNALGRLSPGDRALFYRKYYYLQSTAQIASELGMTARAVEGRLYRLKKRLRTMLGGEGHV